jgi:signal transduction histidine kinase
MEKSSVALDQVLRASVENHRHPAETGRKLVVLDLPEKIPVVVGDAKWLRVVVDNLVSNAVKFSRPGGKVSIRLSDKGDFIEVCVADEGIGIHPEDQGRIFEKFFRARNRSELSVPGTGLGLTITREVVTRHGGRIWFVSDVGKGTQFFVTLPVARQAQAGAD